MSKVPTIGMKDRFIADWLLNIANGLAEQYVPEVKVSSSSSCCSDHQSFTENGFPAIGYFENEGSASDYPHYHKSTDLPEYVHFYAVNKRSVLAAIGISSDQY